MELPESIPCPSCGKPNPPEACACRFCSASITERMSLKIVTAGIVILLLIALAQFYAALTHQPAYTPINELSSDLNFERVRVLGSVEKISVVRGDYSNKMVRIDIRTEDAPAGKETEHTITLRLEGEPAIDFLALNQPLTQGDLVDVAASLFAGEGYRHLSVSSPQFVKVKRKSSVPAAPSAESGGVTVGALLAQPQQFANKQVRVASAVVMSVSDAWPSFQIADPGQTNAPLIVFGYEGRKVNVGERVSVRGKFVFYDKKGYWEIMTTRGDGEAVAPAPDSANE